MNVKGLFNNLEVNHDDANLIVSYKDSIFNYSVKNKRSKATEEGVEVPDLLILIDNETLLAIIQSDKETLLTSYLFGKLEVYGNLSLFVHISDGLNKRLKQKSIRQICRNA